MFEEYAYILDIKKSRYKRLAQAIGEKYFSLLELELKNNVIIGERVYIGQDREKRNKIERVVKRISYDMLTGIAKSELEELLHIIIKNREKEFVDFINNSPPISIRMHSLEILPNLGKKKVSHILEEREKKPFTSFKDINERIKIKIEDILAERILEEIKGNQKYYLFVKHH